MNLRRNSPNFTTLLRRAASPLGAAALCLAVGSLLVGPSAEAAKTTKRKPAKKAPTTKPGGATVTVIGTIREVRTDPTPGAKNWDVTANVKLIWARTGAGAVSTEWSRNKVLSAEVTVTGTGSCAADDGGVTEEDEVQPSQNATYNSAPRVIVNDKAVGSSTSTESAFYAYVTSTQITRLEFQQQTGPCGFVAAFTNCPRTAFPKHALFDSASSAFVFNCETSFQATKIVTTGKLLVQ